jgi:alpha-beta hydrolase superfamily lysophospholipase
LGVEADILGEGFERITLPMGFDDEGEVVATLVRRRNPRPSARAVLYLHGYIDYFFQTGLAEQYVEHGFNFYALDLRKYGRSLLPHQTPYFCRDIREYFPEIDAAMDVIRRQDGNDKVLLNGHSTGGLTASLYAHARRNRGTIGALFLNSPFFQFPGSWISRDMLLPAVGSLGAVGPYRVIPAGLSEFYGLSLHRDYHGEWDYDLAWKPISGVPLLAGWVRAITLAQRRLRAGLDIACPVLVMCSTESSSPKVWNDILLRTDSVLDVTAISRLSERLGNQLTRIRIQDGMHDLVLSTAPVRERVYRELFTWTDAYVSR